MNNTARILVAFALLAMAPAQAWSEDTIVSTELCSGLWIVELVWAPEGRDPVDLVAVFDTGGSRAFVDPETLERISGQRIKEGKKAKFKDMWVAGREFKTFSPEVQDLDHISRALGRDLDIFLPFKTFDNFLLILDYPAGEMRITEGTLVKLDGVAVFNAKGKDKRPWLEVTIGPIERRVLIDSGSSGIISIKKSKKLKWVSEPIPLRLFQGMYDIELKKVGRLDGQAQVGPLVFDEPLISLTDDTELIGAQVMEHYVWTFDQKNRRVRIDPASTSPVRMDPYLGTGMILRPKAGTFEIAHVIEGSPAEEAGLKKGDRVTHVDGVPVMERGCRDFDPELGDSTTLGIERKGEHLEFTVPVAVLVP